MAWECGIDGCGAVFDDLEPAVRHQATEHDSCECRICGSVVPDGYLAIRHAFTEHSRVEYVRAYGASSEEVRHREELLEVVESLADVDAIAAELSRSDSS